jgi:endonuclease III
MVIRKEAFSLATLTAFYDFLDSNLQKEDSVKSLLTKSIFDYFDNMKDTLNYAEKVAPLITDSSLRDDAKNIIKELRRLQSSYGACQY